MIVTWKGGKLAFSAYDLSITVPVVWTSYSESEISQLYNVYVAVGNETYGYETVWSGQLTASRPSTCPRRGDS